MFPARALEGAIRDEIAAAANDRPMPRRAWEPAVDSLTIVRVVCRVEEELAIKLPDDVMLRGGFEDVDHCVTVIVTASRKLWDLKHLVEEEV